MTSYREEQEPVQRQLIFVSPTTWTRYKYQHTPFSAHKALPSDVIVSLEFPSWTTPMYPNLVKTQPHWAPLGLNKPCVHWTPITKFLPINLATPYLKLKTKDLHDMGKLMSNTYVTN